MEYNNVITLLVLLVVIVAVVNASVTFIKIASFNKGVSGYAVTGYINVTIASQLAINISRSLIEWGGGYVNYTLNSSCTNASLITVGDANGVVSPSCCGNWSGANAKSLIVSNIGNVNCTIAIKSDKNSTDMFGPGANDRAFMVNVTNKPGQATCGVPGVGNGAGTITLSSFYDINTSADAIYCNQTYYGTSANTMYIDFKLVVPYNVPVAMQGPSNARLATITITGNAAP